MSEIVSGYQFGGSESARDSLSGTRHSLFARALRSLNRLPSVEQLRLEPERARQFLVDRLTEH
ncbi:MAG: hypothetical protein ACREQ1_14190, partial [Woeseiaceae bacterium]